LEQAVALAAALGDITTRDTSQVFLALVAALKGDIPAAIAQVKKGIEVCRRDGVLRGLFGGLHWLASFLLLEDRPDEALPTAHEAFELSRALISVNFAESLDQFALVAAFRSDFATAARLAGRAHASDRQTMRFASIIREKLMKTLRTAISAERLERLMAEGAAWSEPETIAAVQGL
jgi:hypothetical protein